MPARPAYHKITSAQPDGHGFVQCALNPPDYNGSTGARATGQGFADTPFENPQSDV